jgi:hypothetical protein
MYKKMLLKCDRQTIIDKMDCVRKLFTEEVLDNYLHYSESDFIYTFLKHYPILISISKNLYLDKSDFSLLIFCGAINHVFCSGESPYTREQTTALNELVNTITQLIHKYSNN